MNARRTTILATKPFSNCCCNTLSDLEVSSSSSSQPAKKLHAAQFSQVLKMRQNATLPNSRERASSSTLLLAAKPTQKVHRFQTKVLFFSIQPPKYLPD
jgi:hypothetical protein